MDAFDRTFLVPYNFSIFSIRFFFFFQKNISFSYPPIVLILLISKRDVENHDVGEKKKIEKIGIERKGEEERSGVLVFRLEVHLASRLKFKVSRETIASPRESGRNSPVSDRCLRRGRETRVISISRCGTSKIDLFLSYPVAHRSGRD